MKLKLKSILVMATFLLLGSLVTFAQNTNPMAGQYNFGRGSILLINPDNTFILVGYATVIKGTVIVKGNDISLKPFKPEIPFVIYGRTSQKEALGSKTMFQNFSDAQAVINYDTNNSVPIKMKRVFNIGANCIAYPNVFRMKIPNKTQKLQLAIDDQKTLYEFDNIQGYNDFIVMYLDKKTFDMVLDFTLINNGKALKSKVYEEIYDKYESDVVSKQELEEMGKMFDKSFMPTENYYCNSLYNSFEESGIDLKQYKKTTAGNEYYFIHKNGEIGEENDYQNNSIIYEYKKITTKVLTNQTYTIDDTDSIFQYNCK